MRCAESKFEVTEFIFSLVTIDLSPDETPDLLMVKRVEIMNSYISGRMGISGRGKPITVATISKSIEFFSEPEGTDYEKGVIKKTPVYAFLNKVIDKQEKHPMFLGGFFSSDYEKFKRRYGRYAKISNPKQE